MDLEQKEYVRDLIRNNIEKINLEKTFELSLKIVDLFEENKTSPIEEDIALMVVRDFKLQKMLTRVK